MATGGADGFVRLWQFPSFKPLREIKAHGQEVDDIDFSPDNQKVIELLVKSYILQNTFPNDFVLTFK